MDDIDLAIRLHEYLLLGVRLLSRLRDESNQLFY
jgi:hypothetical protein